MAFSLLEVLSGSNGTGAGNRLRVACHSQLVSNSGTVFKCILDGASDFRVSGHFRSMVGRLLFS